MYKFEKKNMNEIMHIKIIKLLVIITFFVNITKAQDIHFSQFYMSSLSLNPAETGFIDASVRLSNNYRTQWNALGSPFQTISVGADMPFKLNSFSNLGAGIFVANDRSGGSKLTVNKIFVSLSYIFKINNVHELSVGLQPGYIFKDFTQKGLSFPTQFNEETGLFDPEYYSQEYLMSIVAKDNDLKLSYFDLNAGIHYAYKAGKYRPYGGISLFHLLMPTETFLENKESKLGIRMAINGGMFWQLNKNLELNPKVFVMYNKKASDWLMGALLNYYLPDKPVLTKLWAGALTRYSLKNFDSFILTGGLTIWNIEVGISYDLNMSRLIKATKLRGALEAALVYKLYRVKSATITIPCDRY